jgi:hypothetical protein
MRIPRLTYSGVTATMALFLALGGSSYAALSIGGGDIRNGTVTGSDIKNESLKSRDVDNGKLTGTDLKNGSVTTSDIDDASLLAADFKAGELPAGPTGPQGPAGAQGSAGATNVVARRVNVALAAPGIAGTVIEPGLVSCGAGEVAVGGGAGISNALNGPTSIVMSEPVETDGSPPESGEAATQWRAVGKNFDTNDPATMNVHVLCASG